MHLRAVLVVFLVLSGCGSVVALEDEEPEGPACSVGKCGERCMVCEASTCFDGRCNENAICVRPEGTFDCYRSP